MLKNERTVFLFVTKLREEEKRIIEFLKQRDAEIEIITDRSPWDITDLRRCDVALVRSLSQHKALAHAKYIAAFGSKVINTHRAIEICTDKALQSILLSKHELPVPEYRVVHHYDELAGLLPRFGNRFVIKPISSSWGRGVTLIDSDACLDVWLSARESLDARNEHLPVLVQEYIEKDNFDIRVVIVGKRPVVAFKRVSESNWKTNTHLGAHILPIDIDCHIEKLCRDTVNVIGEGIYGLDLMLNTKNGQYVICEINQNPEFASSWKIHKVDIAELIANYTIDSIA